MKNSKIILTLTAILLAASVPASAQRAKSKAKGKAKVERVSETDLLHDIKQRMAAYDFSGAEEALEKYRDHKNANEATADRLEERIALGQSMLERVEKIAVIDSIVVDKADFFKAYNLNPATGTLSSTEVLPPDFPADTATVVYSTENGQRRLWGAPRAGGGTHIVESSLLADDTWEAPVALDEAVNMAGARRVNYPFVMADGITLYYASDDPETSLGGYDIYITRFDGERYLEPQNIGMPYNSTADDYLLAIDETTGAGWWATDRNNLGDKLTIYVYIPQELRVNYPLDTPGLASLAKLTDFKATQPEGTDYTALLARIHAPQGAERRQTADFEFAMPDGRIIHTLDELSSDAARDAMEDYLDALDDLSYLLDDIDEMRRQYAAGNKSLSDRILKAEKEEQNLRASLRRLSNRAVSTEMRSR